MFSISISIGCFCLFWPIFVFFSNDYARAPGCAPTDSASPSLPRCPVCSISESQRAPRNRRPACCLSEMGRNTGDIVRFPPHHSTVPG
jgi:hypothetical protein